MYSLNIGRSIFHRVHLYYTPVSYTHLMVAKVDLPDKSKVWLNSQSYLKYPQKFTGDTRYVEINGEAYFSIQKDKTKKFIVNTPFDIKAEVLGTEFNIEAYKKKNQVTTTLVSGSVRLSFLNKDNKEESVIMKPDEEISYNIKNKKIKLHTSCLLYTSIVDHCLVSLKTKWNERGSLVSDNFKLSLCAAILSVPNNVRCLLYTSRCV